MPAFLNAPLLASALSLADALVLAALILCWIVVGQVIEHPPLRHPSVSVLMKVYRREWMREFLTRQPRIFDASIMDSLRQGTTFFASASMIAAGGTLALFGNTERLHGIAQDLTLPAAAPYVWEARLLPVLFFIADSFLNFVWSHRLFSYCAIVMAAVPNDPDDPLADHRAAQAAEINISAAKNFNRGLRSVYFGIAALAGLIGAGALALAIVIVAAVILRREFWSHSRSVLMNGTPK